MFEAAVNVLVEAISGAIGANIAAAVLSKNIDLGSPILNSIVGAIGGLVGGEILTALIADLHDRIDLVQLIGQIAVGTLAGTGAIVHVGLYNNKMRR
jgi:hypothetical protein